MGRGGVYLRLMGFWPKKVSILGTGVSMVKKSEVVQLLGKWVGRGSRRAFIVTANAEILMWAQKHPDYRGVIGKADLVIADGFGLMPAYWWTHYVFDQGVSLGKKLTVLDWWRGFGELERVPGRILVEELCALSARQGWRVFFLGGAAGVAEVAAEKMRKRYQSRKSGFKIMAWEGSKEAENETIQEWVEAQRKINSFRPHFLMVAFGHPKQEEWIFRHLKDLEVGAAMGVGGTFDYLAGNASLPSGIWGVVGLEALYRLLREPKRWRRVFTALVEFPMAVVSGVA